MRIAAYVYPGYHPIAERDLAFHPGFTEWELVDQCRPRFEGHRQPRLPLMGSYDDRNPVELGKRLQLATSHGVDAFIYGFFWCRGKRVFEDALDQGYLASAVGKRTPFAVMWANRMPRRVLPVRRTDAPVIEDERRVRTDVEDFVELIKTVARSYFRQENYLCVGEKRYFSIFDSTFFINELGPQNAAQAIRLARRWLSDHGYGPLHLAAIDPAPAVSPVLASLGFDSVTHYVHLPRWKGPKLQDYVECATARAQQWPDFLDRCRLPYMPSIAPGWDASPRAADFGTERPGKYPWSPVVTGEHPDHFFEALRRGIHFAAQHPVDDGLLMVSSLNEWSEGHYIEPDQRYGNGWLEAIRSAR